MDRGGSGGRGAPRPPPSSETRATPDGDARHGTFTIAGEAYPVMLLDLPTVVECAATLDDAHLVKTGDVGQVVLVRRPGAPPITATEALDGVTPPMTDARARHFARRPVAAAAAVAAAEDALLRVAAGGAPEGVEFEDFEEEYQAGEGGLGGEWARVERGGGGGAARPRAKKAGEGDEEDEEMPAASAGGGGGEGAGAPSGG
jgi:TATA-binding protein-associated factor Taf7